MSAHRQPLSHALVITMPLLLASIAGAFGGCSNLVGDIGGDAGSTPSGDDANANTNVDAGPIYLDTDGDTTNTVDSSDAAPDCAAEDAGFVTPHQPLGTGP